jgi:tRNA(Arg) A34 adenosine deaminase TadA
MNLNCYDPEELAGIVALRSICAVQVGAVLADHNGIFSWGWNSSGCDGFGEHAEAAAIRRANKRRLRGAAIYVSARRRKSRSVILAKPCGMCASRLQKWGITRITYSSRGGYVKEK